MKNWKNPVERAFELARTGDYSNMDAIKRALEKEGYGVADRSHLTGSSLSRQLSLLCRQARSARQTA